MMLVSDFNSQNFPFPFYAALIMHRGKIISEEYFEPFTSDSLHRMFSITKSYTALAVCALAAEGKISLHDPIIKWFADMTPEHPHPYLSAMTVQDMLDMRTCHASTTYKINMNENWVRSFFITPPDHRSGQIFKYDTSSSHTLAALVKRISGKGVLDYLRTVFPKEVQISEEAHILKNLFGDEIGGSGLTAKPSDLLHTAEFLLAVYNGTWKEKYGAAFSVSESFCSRWCQLIRECLLFRSETLHEGKTLDECQGYGSQFWMIRGGFAMYGMGGQYAAVFPEEELIIVTAADTQAVQGGTQYILDEMHRIDAQIRAEEGKEPAGPSAPEAFEPSGNRDALNHVLQPLVGSWTFLENRQGFLSCRITEDALIMEHRSGTYCFPVSAAKAVPAQDPVYHQNLRVHTAALRDGSLYQHIRILGENVGSIRIMIRGSDGKITVYLRKTEETLYSEMNGFLEAVRK
ncbi:MAG: serine hydrolase [Solobacterium sp.]|nr:serine hydrolase [Solobacterium sp.]